MPETLRCGTPHLIIQVVRFIHDKQISGGVNQSVLTAPELHEMLGKKVLIAKNNALRKL